MIGRSAPLQRRTALRTTTGLRRTTALRSGGHGLKRGEMRRGGPPPPAVRRRGTYGGSTHDPRPKTKARRNRRALDLARQETCLLMVPLVCNRDKATTVSCHSNWGEHGKAGARTADDAYVVFGCSACHFWLDQGNSASGEAKRAVFDAGLLRQMRRWREIADDPLRGDADRCAARWALDILEREVGSLPTACAMWRKARFGAVPEPTPGRLSTELSTEFGDSSGVSNIAARANADSLSFAGPAD
jgi:hypothetical protein